MSIPLTGDGGLFTVFGHAFQAMEALNVCRGQTIPPLTLAFQSEFANISSLDQAWHTAMEGVPPAEIGWRSAGATYQGGIVQALQELLRKYVYDDSGITPTVQEALAYLIAQMRNDGDSVAPNVVDVADISADPNNSPTDVIFAMTLLGTDGRALENLIGEDLELFVTVPGREPTIRFRGESEASDKTSELWPAGSGCEAEIAATASGTGLLVNGGFELEGLDGGPDGWQVTDGIPGTSVKLTPVPVQEVVIAGTPTAGTYMLQYQNPYSSKYHWTGPLAYNATATSLRQELAALPDLSAVQVETTGTAPDYTHKITMWGLGRQPALLVARSNLDTGTITPAIVEAGSAAAFKGRALAIVGGSGTVSLQQPLYGLTRGEVYMCSMRAHREGTPSGSPNLYIYVTDGQSPLTDPAGNVLVWFFPATEITDTLLRWTDLKIAFRLAPDAPEPVYFVIASDGLGAGIEVYLDEATLTAGTQLYPGGPYVSVTAGVVPASETDRWTWQTSNDQAGKFQTWFNRAFDMTNYGLLLPSSDTPTIPNWVNAPSNLQATLTDV